MALVRFSLSRDLVAGYSLAFGTNTGFIQAVSLVNGAGTAANALTDAELRATAVPVSGTFYQATQPVSGTFWQATQPVSGTVTANLGTIAGAALETTLGAASAKLPASLGIKAAADSFSIAPASDASFAVTGPQTDAQFIAALKSSTGTHSSVASGTSSVTILASNANRKGARIFNSDANALYLDLSGGTAVAASRAQVKLATDEGHDVPAGYTGAITGIWASDGSGAASVVEFTV